MTSKELISEPGKYFDISPQGREFILTVPPDSELSEAVLSLKADEQTQKLTCRFKTDSDNWPPQENISWFEADWGESRPLSGLKINAGVQNVKVRVKIFYNGAWLPLMPRDILDVGALQKFPPVIAEKLIAEFVQTSQTPGLWESAAINLTGAEIYAALTPYDLELSVNNKIFFRLDGPMPENTSVNINGFCQAVNAYLSKTDSQKNVPLKISARMPARITVEKLNKSLVFLIKNIENLSPDGKIHIPWEQKVILPVFIDKNAEIDSIAFEYQGNFTKERVYLTPPYKEFLQAHWCNPEHSAAQAFTPLISGTALSSIDLWLRPVKFPVKAGLNLHPDDMGRPAQTPYLKTPVFLEIQEQNQANWACFQLNTPLIIDKNPWWAVLTLESGEVHWGMDLGVHTGVLHAVYQIESGPWIKRKSQAGTPWSLCRLRVQAQNSGSSRISWVRGSHSIEILPDSDGLISLSKLDQLNIEKTEILTLNINAESEGHAYIINPYIRYFIGNTS